MNFYKILSQVPTAWMKTPTNVKSPSQLVGLALNIIITIVIIAAIIYLMLNGLKFITSQGDASKAQEAQKGITFAVIGIVVALSAAVLVNFVMKKLGANMTDELDMKSLVFGVINNLS